MSNNPTSPFNAPKDWIYYALKKLCNEEYFTAKNEIQNFERYVRVLTSFFFENNSSGIDSIFKRVDSKSPSILNENIFFLSEVDKRKYCAAFVEKINKGDFTFDNSFFNNIEDILDYSSFAFDEETTNKIVEKMVEEKMDKRKVNDYVLMSEKGREKRCNEYMIQLQERYLQKLDESVRTRLKVYIGMDVYGSLQ